jgi:hypothetical protein
MVALSLYQVALHRLRNASLSDWETNEEIKETTNAACHHVIEAVRLLNKKFENPKESLSITSLICAAILGASTVRISTRIGFLTLFLATHTPCALSLMFIFEFSLSAETKITFLPTTTEFSR